MRLLTIFAVIFSFLCFFSLGASADSNQVVIQEYGEFLTIRSNGIPNHKTGNFPNSGNPNSISSQNHVFKVSKNPQLSGKATPVGMANFGVARNGVPFDSSTAECYGVKRGARPSKNCEWKEEAIVSGVGQLGLDLNNAHVQPTGTYHYHGVPTSIVKGKNVDHLHIGYAADGFKILFDKTGEAKPSYKLKSGSRPSGPKGEYSGKYTQDFEFIEGYGDLDDCNGKIVDGEYAYFLTEQFPNVPRCWSGSPNQSFMRGPQSGRQGGLNQNRHRRPPPPHHRRGY